MHTKRSTIGDSFFLCFICDFFCKNVLLQGVQDLFLGKEMAMTQKVCNFLPYLGIAKMRFKSSCHTHFVFTSIGVGNA